jgi:hypothetical protein
MLKKHLLSKLKNTSFKNKFSLIYSIKTRKFLTWICNYITIGNY